jgi:heme/copper-type cytochrome/quinol oxidase subunit 4
MKNNSKSSSTTEPVTVSPASNDTESETREVKPANPTQDSYQALIKFLTLKTKISRLDKKQGDLEKVQQDLEKETKETLQTELGNLKDDINKSKTDFIQALALFVALFTFISVNITIFTKIEYLSAGIWFMFLMLLCIIVFSLIFHIILYNKWTGGVELNWLIFLILILIVGLFTSLHNEKLNPMINKNSVESLKENYESRLKNLEIRETELRRQINDTKK